MAVSIYATFATKRGADKVSRALLKARLVACANSFPVASLYRWRGRLESGREVAVIYKTSDANARRTISEITRRHSYEVPCVVAWKITAGNREYLAWMDAEASGRETPRRQARKGKSRQGKRAIAKRRGRGGTPSTRVGRRAQR
ncbi:MAG: divalent-cation tolerance protein CutA [Euryarchaeota archaeon]|nr:divalent-cation tolerance protein CutA [Euryarchaeota archaeon]